MGEIRVNVLDCKIGNVLSKNVISIKGLEIAQKDAVIDVYIKYKLIRSGIKSVWIYDVSAYQQRALTKINYDKVKACYSESIITLEKVFEELDTLKPLDHSRVKYIAKSIYECTEETECIIKYLQEKKEYGDYTLCHSINVSFYVMLLGKWMSMPKSRIIDLIIAGLLHDVGKLGIPEYILSKSESVNTEEFKLIRYHALFGYAMLTKIRGLNEDIRKGVLMHHERIDGTGYPNKVTGNSIGEYAKVIAIADIYDAMTTDRVYKKRANPFEAFGVLLKAAGRSLEANIINTFITNMITYFLGIEAKLEHTKEHYSISNLPYKIIRPSSQSKLMYRVI